MASISLLASAIDHVHADAGKQLARTRVLTSPHVAETTRPNSALIGIALGDSTDSRPRADVVALACSATGLVGGIGAYIVNRLD